MLTEDIPFTISRPSELYKIVNNVLILGQWWNKAWTHSESRSCGLYCQGFIKRSQKKNSYRLAVSPPFPQRLNNLQYIMIIYFTFLFLYQKYYYDTNIILVVRWRKRTTTRTR